MDPDATTVATTGVVCVVLLAVVVVDICMRDGALCAFCAADEDGRVDKLIPIRVAAQHILRHLVQETTHVFLTSSMLKR